MDIRDKVAQSPMTAFQVRAVVLCVLLNMIDGFDVLVMPFTAKRLARSSRSVMSSSATYSVPPSSAWRSALSCSPRSPIGSVAGG